VGQGKEHIKKYAYAYPAAERLAFCSIAAMIAAMYAGNFSIPYDTLDIGLRLVAATLIGVLLGLERVLRGKQTGIRTLGLVSFAAALVTLATMHAKDILSNTDALARVLQGALQGILVGIGFLGGGILLRDEQARKVYNLTSAAEVWAVAAMGLATAVAPWAIVGLGFVIFVLLMIGLRALEEKFHLKDHNDKT
jgi:putative Mg2+ transporter-C (MgtC) family protein